jgi:hypothetical protein
MTYSHAGRWGDLLASGSFEASALGAANALQRIGSATPFYSLNEAIKEGGRSIRSLTRKGFRALDSRFVGVALSSTDSPKLELDALTAAGIARRVGEDVDREWDAYYTAESRCFEVDDGE